MHHPEAAAQMRQIDLAQIGAVDLEVAAVLAIDALKQARDGRFARAAAADEAEHGARRNLEGDAVKGGDLGPRIGEGEVLECDRAFEFRPQARAHRGRFGRVVEHVRHLRHRQANFFDILHELGEANERARDAPAEHHEGDREHRR